MKKWLAALAILIPALAWSQVQTPYLAPAPIGTNISALQNYNLGSLYKFQAAIARANSGGAPVKVAFYGDSLTGGALSGTGTTPQYRLNGFVPALAAILNAGGHPATWANAFGNACSGACSASSPGVWDSRLAGTGGFSTDASGVLTIGGLTSFTSVAGTLSFTTGVSTNTCDLWYYDAGTQTFTTNVDGGTTISTVTGGASGQLQKANITYALGPHTVNIVWVNGNLHVIGFDCWDSTLNQMKFYNFGIGGAVAATLNTTGTVYAPLTALEKIAPDLTLVTIGTNDWAAGNWTQAYNTALQGVITGAQLSGDVILFSPPPSATAITAQANQALYVQNMAGLALANNVPYIDIFDTFGTQAKMSTNSMSGDNYHPNTKGYLFWAGYLAQAFSTIFQ